jgi:hypothetical protein
MQRRGIFLLTLVCRCTQPIANISEGYMTLSAHMNNVANLQHTGVDVGDHVEARELVPDDATQG